MELELECGALERGDAAELACGSAVKPASEIAAAVSIPSAITRRLWNNRFIVFSLPVPLYSSIH